MNVDQLRQELQQGSTPYLRQRRVTLGLSLAGIASMAPTTLLQTGVPKHLPDPPLKSFDSDKVNSSYDAYRFGLPDGTLGILSFAANLPLLPFGGADRAQDKPWVPLVATGKAAVDAVVALRRGHGASTASPASSLAWASSPLHSQRRARPSPRCKASEWKSTQRACNRPARLHAVLCAESANVVQPDSSQEDERCGQSA